MMLILTTLLHGPTPARGHEAAIPEEGKASKAALHVAPAGDLYPPYIADPHRPGNAVLLMAIPDSTIPATGSPRFNLKTGGRFGLLRSRPASNREKGWQLSIEGGLDGQFDLENEQDNIGWDGNYGMVLTFARSERLGLKLGARHTSSHLGDEYLQSTGRKRLGYRRLDLSLGTAWKPVPHLRLYADGGYGVDQGAGSVQDPLRLQAGLEFLAPKRFWKGRAAWYLALDATAMQERSWRLDTALQTGFELPSTGRVWRLGVEVYRGRPSMGEFFQHTESHIALGLWLDL